MENHQTKNGYELPRKVAILYSEVKREYFHTEKAYISEKDAKKYSEIIARYSEKLGIETILIPGDSSLVDSLKKSKPEMVLNFVDTFKGSDYKASTIPAVLDFLEIPYVGTDSLGLSLCTNKFLVSQLLKSNGLPVANSQLFNTPNDYLDPTLRFPLFAKLNETHGSIDLTEEAVLEDEKQLRVRLKFLIETYKESVLVEEFIVGREVTAALLEGLNKKVYFGERIFPESESKYKFLSYELKWGSDDKQGVEYQKYEDPVLREYVKKAFSVLGMYDYARFDIRIDDSGRYFFLDSNPNPFLGPKEVGGSMGIILDQNGVTYEETLQRLLINTVRDIQGKERI